MLVKGLVISVLMFFVALQAEGASPGDLDECFRSASIRYGVEESLLKAIAYVESGMNERARNVNRDGSEDIGLMQINSSWLKVLRNYGVTKEDLYDGCVSIHVGAWILANNVYTHGYTWKAVGAYNARSERKQLRYIEKVAPVVKYLRGQSK